MTVDHWKLQLRGLILCEALRFARLARRR